MSSSAPVEATRRVLSPRQARTVQALVEAALEELRSAGYEELTVRSVARRAGVAPATAYTYFGSKEHLVTEAFWRRLSDLPDPKLDRRRSMADRVSDALAGFNELAAAEPELLTACTAAMLVDDPHVRRLRDRIARRLHDLFVAAVGERADPAVVRALDLAMAGALVRAGTGHLAYDRVPAIMAEVAGLLREGRR